MFYMKHKVTTNPTFLKERYALFLCTKKAFLRKYAV